MKFYAIAFYWPDGSVGFNTNFNQQIHRGPKAEAKELLRFVQGKNTERKYFLLKLKTKRFT